MKSLALMFFILTFSFNLWSQNNASKIVATVNGVNITKAQFDEYHLQNLKFIGQRKIDTQVSLQDLINRELGIQKAKKSGIDKDPTVIARMNDILYHAQISKDLEGQFKKITVSDEEVKKYYQDNKEYRTAHILTRVRATPSADEVKQALEQSMQIYQELKSNPDAFSKLANKYSQTTVASVGGDLGFQPPNRLAPEYYAAIKGQKVGHITQPIRTQMGFHIIRIIAVKDFDKIDKNVYKKIIYDLKRDSIMANYFKSLQSGSSIKILKENL